MSRRDNKRSYCECTGEASNYIPGKDMCSNDIRVEGSTSFRVGLFGPAIGLQFLISGDIYSVCFGHLWTECDICEIR